MLQQLYLKNFILIDEITLDFKQGFSVFVGETGAGKSLIVSALQIIKGERASSSLIKKNKDKAIIEAIFTLSPQLQSQIGEYGIEVEDEILITKEITLEKTITKLNHRPITNTLLKTLMTHVIEIHAQHSLHEFLNEKTHLHLLDAYGKIDLTSYKKTYTELKQLKQELSTLVNDETNDIDYLKFQLQEITKLDPQKDEDVTLREIQKTYLEKTKQKDIIFKLLSEIQIDSVYNLTKEIAFLPELKEKMLDAYYVLEESIQQIADTFHENEDVDIDEIQNRLFKIQALKKKYGGSLDNVLSKKDYYETKIYQLEEKDFLIQQLENQIIIKENQCVQEAQSISQQRQLAAKKLETDLQKTLSTLAFNFVDFKIKFEPEKIYNSGIDKITFLISLNKGEDLKKLTQVASGGELSRILLALKAIFAQYQAIDTIVFDEIDTGVSGKVAFEIGKKLNAMAENKQVLNISHLAAVIACADHVYGVKKTEIQEQTVSMITQLSQPEIIEELAMIASSNLSKQSILSAQKLYSLAKDELKNG